MLGLWRVRDDTALANGELAAGPAPPASGTVPALPPLSSPPLNSHPMHRDWVKRTTRREHAAQLGTQALNAPFLGLVSLARVKRASSVAESQQVQEGASKHNSGFCAVPKPFPKTIEGPPAASTRVDVIAESKLQGLPLPSNNAVNPQALHYMLWPPSSCTCWTKRFFPPCLAAYMARSASANIFSGDGGELVNVIPPMLKVTGYSCTAIEF